MSLTKRLLVNYELQIENLTISKMNLIEHILSLNIPIIEIVKELNISRATLYRWIKEYKDSLSIQTSKHKMHGLSKHPLYYKWWSMICRCTYSSNDNYKYYGGKGVRVCQEWLESFLAFYNWSIENGWELGLTIDRLDPEGDYEPGNCRFLTASENSRRASVKGTANKINQLKHFLSSDITITAVAKEMGVSRSTIYRWIKKHHVSRCVNRLTSAQ